MKYPSIIALLLTFSCGMLSGETYKNSPVSSWAAGSDWWTLFKDPMATVLASGIDVNNQNVKAAEARLNQARAAIGAARADLLPTVDAAYSANKSRGSGANDFVFPVLSTRTHQAAFQTAYEVDLWGKVRKGILASKADFAASEAALEALKLSLRAEVVGVYYRLRSLDAEKAKLEETVKWRQEALSLTKAKLDAGTGNDLDVERAKTELATSEADVAAVKEQRAILENALALLTGKKANEFRLAAADQALKFPPTIPTGLPSELVRRRPDIVQAEKILQAANARIGVAKAAYFPALKLNAEAGWQGNELKRLGDSKAEFYGLGFSFNIPLFDGGRRKASMEGAKAVAEEAQSQYEQAVLTAFQEVENALSSVNAIAGQREALTRAVDSASKAAKLSRNRYDNGLVSYFEVIEADRTVLALERSAEQLRGRHFSSVVDLIKALGGGWNSSKQ